MKTTLNLRDDLLRRAKARAALQGEPLARYIERGLEERLEREEALPSSVGKWLESLPKVSSSAASDLEKALSEDHFREIDDSMWS
ncbi:MAG: hypothetical protein AAF555_11815 [Verrucomicrobiota bacterium]